MLFKAPLCLVLAGLLRTGTAVAPECSVTGITTTIWPNGDPTTRANGGDNIFSILGSPPTTDSEATSIETSAAMTVDGPTLTSALPTESISNLVGSDDVPSLTTTASFTNPTGGAGPVAGLRPGMFGLFGAAAVAAVLA